LVDRHVSNDAPLITRVPYLADGSHAQDADDLNWCVDTLHSQIVPGQLRHLTHQDSTCLFSSVCQELDNGSEVIENSPDNVAKFRSGNEGVFVPDGSLQSDPIRRLCDRPTPL